MSNLVTYTGVCVNGPRDGQIVTKEHMTFDAPQQVTDHTKNQTSGPALSKTTYRFHRIGVSDFVEGRLIEKGFWIPVGSSFAEAHLLLANAYVAHRKLQRDIKDA